MQRFLVVTGLPASGKTTLASRLRDDLRVPMLDKDAILEKLFDRVSVQDLNSRSRLSREADETLISEAKQLPQAIVVSWWRHPASTSDTGTPIEWLQHGSAVELYVTCPIELAATRFLARQRHPGHFDSRWSREELVRWLQRQASYGPLGVGKCIEVGAEVVYSEVLAKVQSALGQAQSVA
jgi:shikimate kinase